jgi:hypothetical protein
MDRQAIQRRIAEFQRAYMTDPEFLDRQYQMPSLAELLTNSDVVGVSRFIEHPAFEPERLFTFVYRANSIEISAVIGATSLWCSMPSVYQAADTGEWGVEEGEPFEYSEVWRRSTVLELSSKICPSLLRNWEGVRTASTRAGECSTDTCDGMVYRHRVADREFQSSVDWYNPEAPEHLSQVALIEAYVELLRGVRLYTE